jgi:hypothetical protein
MRVLDQWSLPVDLTVLDLQASIAVRGRRAFVRAGPFFHAVSRVSMDLSKLDLPGVSQALDDSDPDREHFLDLREGSLWTFVFSESTDETRRRLGEIRAGMGETYRAIPSMTTQEAYEEIEDFVEAVESPEVQEALFRAIERKGALRNFREAILQYPEERTRWSAHRRERSRRRLERFLESLGSPAAPSMDGAG